MTENFHPDENFVQTSEMLKSGIKRKSNLLDESGNIDSKRANIYSAWRERTFSETKELEEDFGKKKVDYVRDWVSKNKYSTEERSTTKRDDARCAEDEIHNPQKYRHPSQPEEGYSQLRIESHRKEFNSSNELHEYRPSINTSNELHEHRLPINTSNELHEYRPSINTSIELHEYRPSINTSNELHEYRPSSGQIIHPVEPGFDEYRRQRFEKTLPTHINNRVQVSDISRHYARPSNTEPNKSNELQEYRTPSGQFSHSREPSFDGYGKNCGQFFDKKLPNNNQRIISEDAAKRPSNTAKDILAPGPNKSGIVRQVWINGPAESECSSGDTAFIRLRKQCSTNKSTQSPEAKKYHTPSKRKFEEHGDNDSHWDSSSLMSSSSSEGVTDTESQVSICQADIGLTNEKHESGNITKGDLQNNSSCNSNVKQSGVSMLGTIMNVLMTPMRMFGRNKN